MDNPTLIELPKTWRLPKAWAEKALESRKEWNLDHVKACAKSFHSWNTSKHNTRNSLDEWEQAWLAWVIRQRTELLNVKAKKEDQWWNSASGIEAKGKEFGLTYDQKTCFAYFKEKVFEVAKHNPRQK